MRVRRRFQYSRSRSIARCTALCLLICCKSLLDLSRAFSNIIGDCNPIMYLNSIKLLVLYFAIFAFLLYGNAIIIYSSQSTMNVTFIHTTNNLTVGANAHCTKENSWTIPGFDFGNYHYSCQEAMRRAQHDIARYGLDTDVEFLDQGATAQTTKPKVFLPRKYPVNMRKCLDLHQDSFFEHGSFGQKLSIPISHPALWLSP